MPIGHDHGCKRLMRVPAHWIVDGEISACEHYRYKLTQRWGPGKLVLFCMMNPSGADPNVTDMTVAKCARLASRWGYGGIMVGNACAYRATNKNRPSGRAGSRGQKERRGAVGDGCRGGDDHYRARQAPGEAAGASRCHVRVAQVSRPQTARTTSAGRWGADAPSRARQGTTFPKTYSPWHGRSGRHLPVLAGFVTH